MKADIDWDAASRRRAHNCRDLQTRRMSHRQLPKQRLPSAPVLIVACACASFLMLPILGLLARTPWSSLWSDLTSPVAADALRLSLECSLWATGLSLVFGIPLAWVLARSDFPGRNFLRTITILPMVLPPIVAGVALLSVFGRDGLIGSHLYHWFGIQFTFNSAGVVLAEMFVSMPFMVITLEGALRSMDDRYVQAAASLGAGRWRVFRYVTAPLVSSSLVAGTALTWARALGEFGATITFAGDIEGRTQTLPLAVYLALQSSEQVAVALSLALLAICVVVLFSLRSHWIGALAS
jgi:molybdate transport system permease protein